MTEGSLADTYPATSWAYRSLSVEWFLKALTELLANFPVNIVASRQLRPLRAVIRSLQRAFAALFVFLCLTSVCDDKMIKNKLSLEQ